MLYRSNTARVLCPLIFMARASERPQYWTMLRIAERLMSCARMSGTPAFLRARFQDLTNPFSFEPASLLATASQSFLCQNRTYRSEERRVGKECRPPWSPQH